MSALPFWVIPGLAVHLHFLMTRHLMLSTPSRSPTTPHQSEAMASGSLTFRTPHIEEVPIAHTRQAPGFAWVAVPKDLDPAKKALETAGKKRARTAGVQTEAQKEAATTRQQRETERRIRDLNNDGTRDVNIPSLKDGRAGNTKAGKTQNTKKILASGKKFEHYLDDEEAELARTGRVDGMDKEEAPPARANKTPYARRPQQEEDVEMTESTVPALPFFTQPASTSLDDAQFDNDFDAIPPVPSAAEIQALLDAPPLTYNGARLAPSYMPVAAPRVFCEVCGYWGRFKCLKCGSRTCSVDCEAIHVADRCLKFYA